MTEKTTTGGRRLSKTFIPEFILVGIIGFILSFFISFWFVLAIAGFYLLIRIRPRIFAVMLEGLGDIIESACDIFGDIADSDSDFFGDD